MESKKLNEKVLEVTPSRSVALLARTKELQKTDPDILNMTGGDPDFATPQEICEETMAWMMKGFTHYTDSKGEPELRERIAKKLQEENGAPYKAGDILITPGAKYAVYLSILAVTNPGDEVIWLTPGWVSYPSIVTICGGTPIAVHLDYDNDYRITYEALAQAATEKTTALVINYPNNPTGRILHPEEIAAIKRFMMDYPRVTLISDEIYEKIIYDGQKVISPACDPELFERTIVINGFSKCSAMTGWRLGYLACTGELYNCIFKVFSHSMSCVSGFLQKGALKAMDLPQETEKMRAAYEKRRDLILEGFKGLKNIELAAPSGAFYAWVRFKTEKDSETVCTELLEKVKVAGIPGDSYGEEKACCVRFSFACSEDTILKFTERMARYDQML